MHWKTVTAATASLAALILQSPALADEAPEVSQVVVTAPRTTDLEQVVGVDKTGTPIKDQPRSIQVVPDVLIHEQGGIHLIDALRDVSGATQGGQFAFGFFDRVIVRGLNVTYLNDGLPDGTSDLTGIVHSLTGVQQVEVLKGPGSALYGDTEEGGTINIVHYKPSDVLGAGISEQYGSFNTSTTDAYITGPTGLAHVDYRVDAEYQTSDGFRGQASENAEVHTAFSYRPENHDVELRLEYQHLDATPNSVGIPFSPPKGTGLPINVSVDNTYYTPYAYADQDVARIFLSDAWTVSDFLTVNLRGAYTHRDVDLMRNSGGSVAADASDPGDYELTNLQIREQHDHIGDLNLQAEPTWRFSTGPLKHVLVTGAEVRSIDGTTWRETADLPNITNIYAPVVNDPPVSSLDFQCNATHSCDDADLRARFYGLYAIDQIDVTQRLKLRLSVRQDWFDTEGVARALLPANAGQEQPCNPPSASACPWVPGHPVKQDDDPASFDVGAVYNLTSDLSLFGGYSSDFYPIFNTEEPETIGQKSERGIQTEVGLRGQTGGWLSASTSLYQVSRDDVFTLLTEAVPGGDIDVPQTFSYQVQGWETDVNLRLTRSWNVLFNTAVQDGKITSYPQTPADIGHAPPSVPSFLANFFTSYDWALPGEAGTLQGSFGVRYRDHEYADAGLTRLIPGEPLLDLGLSWTRGRFTTSAGVQNLLDQRNFLYGDGTGGGALPGTGLTAWVRLAAKL